MAGKYATGTSVSTGASIEEIRRTVDRYGASAFGFFTEEGEHVSRAAITFIAHGRQVRMVVELPSRGDREFTHTPSRGTRREPAAAHAAWEQACRQKWRALALLVKGLLEAVESGIVTFEQAWLPYTVLPGTSLTVYERIGEELEEAILGGRSPRLAIMPAPEESE